MGVLTKSLTILLIAISTPIIYRQFATDNTVKFMSSYYSNYKAIDHFLRQSANHLDCAKDYLPESKQVKSVVDKLNKQIVDMIENVRSRSQSNDEKISDMSKKSDKSEEKVAKKSTIKMSSCPGEANPVRVWTKDELSQFDGSNGETIYLAFLGSVYDVSINMQHYATGAEYNAFAGRDATRAFITGNFTHDLHDDISDIEESLYSHIEGWMSFYSNSYPNLGRIEGRFFDSNGCSTSELSKVYQVFAKLAEQKESQREQERVYPDCNSEWNSELGKGRVWCSKQSGGIERDWVGVPRILDNGQAPKCVCLNLDQGETNSGSSISEYPGCDSKASECPLTQ